MSGNVQTWCSQLNERRKNVTIKYKNFRHHMTRWFSSSAATAWFGDTQTISPSIYFLITISSASWATVFSICEWSGLCPLTKPASLSSLTTWSRPRSGPVTEGVFPTRVWVSAGVRVSEPNKMSFFYDDCQGKTSINRSANIRTAISQTWSLITCQLLACEYPIRKVYLDFGGLLNNPN